MGFSTTSFGLPAVTNVSFRCCCCVICTFFASAGISLSCSAVPRQRRRSPAAVSYCAFSELFVSATLYVPGFCELNVERAAEFARVRVGDFHRLAVGAQHLEVVEPQRLMIEVEEVVRYRAVERHPARAREHRFRRHDERPMRFRCEGQGSR